MTNNFPRFSRTIALGVCLVALALVSGCGSSGKEAKNQVTGKVTLDGKPVNGAIVFVEGGKEYQSPISSTDGTYQINDAPNGNMKVYIKGSAAALGGKLIEPKAGAGAPEMPKNLGGGTGVEAPTKYGSVATSGLSFEVKGGKQQQDFPLTP